MAINYTTLKNYIAAVPEWDALPKNSDTAFFIAVELNKEAPNNYVVWRTAVPVDEIMRNGLDWTRVDNLSVGKARIWDWMTRLDTLNPSKVNIRAGIDATWVGTAADLAVRAVVYTHCKRKASVVEKLFATGTGTDASPAAMGYEGPIPYQEILTAWDA
jgi:hypothetical protein